MSCSTENQFLLYQKEKFRKKTERCNRSSKNIEVENPIYSYYYFFFLRKKSYLDPISQYLWIIPYQIMEFKAPFSFVYKIQQNSGIMFNIVR